MDEQGQIQLTPVQVAEFAVGEGLTDITNQLGALAGYIGGVAGLRGYTGRLNGVDSPLRSVVQDVRARLDLIHQKNVDLLLELEALAIEADAQAASAVEEL